MYVLQICHNYKPPFLNVAAQYASLFEGSPYQVVTVYLKGEPREDVIQKSRSHKVIFLDFHKNDLRGLKRKAILAVRDLHQHYQFQFAVAHRYKAIYISTHVKHLFVIGVHHIDSVYKRWTRRWYVVRRQKQLVLLGVSKAIRDDIRNWLPTYPQDRIVHLYNGLDFEKIRSEQWTREDARRHLGLPQSAFIFGSVGRLHRDKDPKTLVTAFAKAAPHMPNAMLVIAGSGPLKKAIERMIADFNMEGRILLPGMIPDVYRFFQAFDGFILASIREGMPLALLEAFAAKNICAASRCNGNYEAIDGVGFSFDIGNHDALARVLCRIYEMSDADKQAIRAKMEERINTTFHEKQIRQFFWAMPMMQAFYKPM